MLTIFNFKNKLSIHEQLDLLKLFNEGNVKTELIISPIIPVNDNEYSFSIASQNIAIKGRNVGDLTCEHLNYYNIKYAFVGHLERQKFLNETKDIIRSKIKQTIVGNITPIICFGKNKNYIAEIHQLLSGIQFQGKEIIIAYEILSATLSGKKDYSLEEISNHLTMLKRYLFISSQIYNFKYKLVFGGGVQCKDIPEIIKLGFDGVLIEDRTNTLLEVFNFLNQKEFSN